MKKLILLFVLLGITFLTGLSQRFDYEKSSNIFFGLNMGSTWQTTDVVNQTRPIGGGGFIFGGTIGRDYGRMLSFDLRLRYLGGHWYGQDSDTTSSIGQNIALNNVYGSTGYAVQNFRTRNHSLSLELAIHANRFRERTGWDPYIFGGIGANARFTDGDLFDDEGISYDYTTNPTATFSTTGYDTPLDLDATSTHDDAGIYNSNWAPSLGVGIGYYFGNRFSLGLEHKTTFAQDNYFDGTIVNQNGEVSGKNDMFHYTSVYARWYLRRGNRSYSPNTVTPVAPPNVTPGTTSGLTQKPTVTYTNPNTTPRVVNSPTFILRADILHVSAAQNVTFRQDGGVNHNFTFNPLTTRFQSTVQLNPGQNEFRLRGTNQYGADEATVIIIYERDEVAPNNPPIVTITDPAVSPHTTSNAVYTVKSTIVNVSAKNQVTVSVNGTNSTNFTYNQLSTHQAAVSVALNLVSSTTTVLISATNPSGQHSDQTTIIKKESETIPPPIVSFFNPSQQPISVSSPNFNLVGQVLNVTSKNNVAFFQNGSVNQNFTFNATNKDFASQVVLVPGQNIFQLLGSNTAGTDQKTVVINYTIPSPKPPIVTITNPAIQPHTTNNDTYNLAATVLNVSNANQINMLLNGSIFTNFSFNATNSALNALISLQEGSNVVKITGTNSDGTDSKQTVIIYKKPVVILPPVVEYINPGVNPFQTNIASHGVIASVFNVTASNQINVNLNGQPITNFTFNPVNHIVAFTTPLLPGANTVNIIGTNSAGVDSKNQTIIYIDPSTQLPPVITYLDPAVNPATVYTSSYLVTAKVKHVQNNQNIILKINGVQSTNFVYSTSSELMSFTTSLLEGANIIEITATNNYGQDVESTTLIYKKQNTLLPPTVTITNPSVDPYETSSSNVSVTALTSNVISTSEVSVTVNNSNLNFDFNPSSGEVTFNVDLTEGNNTVAVTVYNPNGTASDNTAIIYTVPVVINPPVVNITSPSVSPHIVPQGGYNFVGNVQNLENVGQLQVFLNGQSYANINAVMNNGVVNFNVPVTINTTHTSFELIAVATNSAGSDQDDAVIELEVVEDDDSTPNCLPTVNAEFADDDQSVTASSTLDLSNVVLQFSNGTTQKFEGLSGLSQTFSGTGANAGMCITGIWIKSGCNQSNDGPGYGEWIPNSEYDGSCESTPCIPPAINITSGNNVTEANYNLQVIVSDASANHITVTLNGSSVNANFNATTNLLSANVVLNEGNNEIVITAAECETISETLIVKYTIPCNPLTYTLVYPSQTNVSVTDPVISSLNLTVKDVTNTGVAVTVNGTNTPFVLNGNTLSVANINLANGANSITVSLSNNCSSETITYIVNYAAPVGPCGPRINPGNAEWQFCLVTPSGTYNRNDLASNPNFTYSGPASSVYFLPIAGGGDVILNGSAYSVQNGTYYLFEGNINITVSSNQPGAMGHWTLCIETNQAPVFGKGNNRPQSPCEAGKSQQNSGTGGSGPQKSSGTSTPQTEKKSSGSDLVPKERTNSTNTTTPKPTPTRGDVSVPKKEKVDTTKTPSPTPSPIKSTTGGTRRN